MNRRTILGSLALLPIATRAAALQLRPNVVVYWDGIATGRLRYNPHLGPVGDAIMGGGLHTAIYNAWAVYSDVAVATIPTKGRRPAAERTGAAMEEAISYAAYRFLLDRFPDPASASHFGAAMERLGFDPSIVSTGDTPAGVGAAAADAVIAWRADDRSNYRGQMNGKSYTDYTGYVPANQPMEFSNPRIVGRFNGTLSRDFVPATDVFAWQPLKNPAGVVQKYAGVQMGDVLPHMLMPEDVAQVDKLLGKPKYLTDAALFEAECVASLALSANLTDQQKLMIEFWADGPGSKFYPTAHWRYFSADVVARRHYDLGAAVKLFFVVATTAADAGIMTWRAKRISNGSRPITGIRNVYNGREVRAWGGPGYQAETIYGETFSPFNPSDPDMVAAHQSPGFPGYPSGHTMFSGSCARALELVTGSKEFGFSTAIPADFGIVEPHRPPIATTIGFPTFQAAAQSATLSRVWSGIHFAPDCSDAVMKVGAGIGDIVWKRARRYFAGQI